MAFRKLIMERVSKAVQPRTEEEFALRLDGVDVEINGDQSRVFLGAKHKEVYSLRHFAGGWKITELPSGQ